MCHRETALGETTIGEVSFYDARLVETVRWIRLVAYPDQLIGEVGPGRHSRVYWEEANDSTSGSGTEVSGA